MLANQTLTGVLIDEVTLDLDELARACKVEPEWVVRHVQAGVLGALGGEGAAQLTSVRFRSVDLARARRLFELERDFDANEQLAALVIDLADEVRRLRTRLRTLGLRDT